MTKTGLVFILFFLSITASAQISWGVKGGMNVSTLGNFDPLYKPRLGYHIGAYYLQHLDVQYGLQAELQYSLQGARDASYATRNLAYNYLHLPVLLRFFLENGTTTVDVGPQFSYLVRARIKEDGFTYPVPDKVRAFDMSALVGMSNEADWGQYGFRFGWGFFNTSGGSVGAPNVYRNLLLQLSVGIKVSEWTD